MASGGDGEGVGRRGKEAELMNCPIREVGELGQG